MTGLHLRSYPSNLKVTVERNGSGVASGENQLDYDESSVNGPGCDPVCKTGRFTISVTSP